MKKETRGGPTQLSSGWVYCQDRMPAKWEICIVATITNISPRAAMVWNGKNWLVGLSDDVYKETVLHWMPWPEAPYK